MLYQNQFYYMIYVTIMNQIRLSLVEILVTDPYMSNKMAQNISNRDESFLDLHDQIE